MSENINNKNANERTEYTDEMLPELTAEQQEAAVSYGSKMWMMVRLGEENIGNFEFSDAMGVGIQIVSSNKMRCINVVDHPAALTFLALLKATSEAISVEFETGQYTVLSPCHLHENEDDNDHDDDDNIGMEVA